MISINLILLIELILFKRRKQLQVDFKLKMIKKVRIRMLFLIMLFLICAKKIQFNKIQNYNSNRVKSNKIILIKINNH
jgi:hypothetical protein